MSTAEVKRYWNKIAAMGCVVCGREAEIAHCHGGSITERTGVKAKGKKLAYMDWLVLPLCPRHHRTAKEALDVDVRAFEFIYGEQVSLINEMVRRTGIDVWAKAVSRHDWAKVAA